MDLFKMSSDELFTLQKAISEENNNRHLAELEKRKIKAQEKFKMVKANKDIILPLIPHSCCSCNGDDCTDNSYIEHGVPRCVRCYLNEVVEYDRLPDDFDIDIDIKISPIS